jgi:hypothetical protein
MKTGSFGCNRSIDRPLRIKTFLVTRTRGGRQASISFESQLRQAGANPVQKTYPVRAPTGQSSARPVVGEPLTASGYKPLAGRSIKNWGKG